MSYIRYSSDYKYVDGSSDDYIFRTDDDDGKEYIKDYDHISNNTIVELVSHVIKDDCCKDEVFINYLIGKLAERLKVKLK